MENHFEHIFSQEEIKVHIPFLVLDLGDFRISITGKF